MRNAAEPRVLVTGGAGFLGSHLCDRLLSDGAHVTCLDNLFTGSKLNIEHLLTHPRFDFVQHDITNPVFLQVDEIYNLACPASPVHYQYDPIHTTKTSVLGAINVLGLAKRVNARVLHASTSEVYGDPEVHPQKEGYAGRVSCIGPRACYDEGKRCAETLLFDYRRKHGIEVKVVRIFNTYGPRMHPNDGRVVSNFIVQAIRGEPITIYGEGQQTRSFCYVDDMIEGLVRLMKSPSDLTGPVNIGNPGEFTIAELADLVLEMTGSSSTRRFEPLPADDPKLRRPDIELAQSALSWTPQVDLREGLQRTIDYFRQLLDEPRAVHPRRESVRPLPVSRAAG